MAARDGRFYRHGVEEALAVGGIGLFGFAAGLLATKVFRTSSGSEAWLFGMAVPANPEPAAMLLVVLAALGASAVASDRELSAARSEAEQARRLALAEAGHAERIGHLEFELAKASSALENAAAEATLRESRARSGQAESVDQRTAELQDALRRLEAELGQAMAAMRLRLSSLLVEMRTTSFRVGQTGEGIADDGHALAEGAVRQCRVVDGAVTSIRRLGQEAGQQARSLDDLAGHATALQTRTADGDRVMAQTAEQIGALQDSTRRVAEINDLVDDIAFQTNLLALNAAVEAARAGAAGKGFAVVASEVRGLAKRCTDAAAEIRTLIDRITDRPPEPPFDTCTMSDGTAYDAAEVAFARPSGLSPAGWICPEPALMAFDETGQADTQERKVRIQGAVRTNAKGERLVTLFLVNDQREPETNRDSAWLFQPELSVKGSGQAAGTPVFLRRPSNDVVVDDAERVVAANRVPTRRRPNAPDSVACLPRASRAATRCPH